MVHQLNTNVEDNVAPIEIRDDFDVKLVQFAGDDQMIVNAARVSTLSDNPFEEMEAGSDKLISFLMRNRHGSPFEHGLMTFRIEAPIFVWREFMRHRIGTSYNEQSGRYTEMRGEFYIPNKTRNLVQVGKPGKYDFVEGSDEQFHLMDGALYDVAQVAWNMYQKMLAEGIAKEVARMCLPVNIYSAAYVTMNPRSLMHFLSLRTQNPQSKFPSFPQAEIFAVAGQMEDIFEGLYPLTYRAFQESGRVCP